TDNAYTIRTNRFPASKKPTVLYKQAHSFLILVIRSDYKNTDFGNLNESSFKDIWNNSAFTGARKIFRTQKPGNISTPCGRCVDARGFEDPGYDLINENLTNLIGRPGQTDI
ncbi:MAG: SPASM domain-containing protein, partial [Ignavibacteria bacterium]|nr:SPASM domain-containing protein [Ignavibacteria bacterium]